MKHTAGFIILIITVLLAPGLSFAKSLDFSASIGVKETYDDNLFLTRTDREHDFITTINPHASLNYSPHETLNFNLNYGLNFRFYARHSERNDTSLSRTQDAQFRTDFRPFKYMFIEVSDVYTRVPIDSRANSVADNFVTNMTDSNTFRVSPHINYPITPTIAAKIGYAYTNLWYREGNSSDTHTGFASLSKHFPMGLTLSLNYDFTAYRPRDTIDDYDSHQGSVSAHYQTARGFSVWGEVGRSEMDYAELSNKTVDFWDVGTNYTFRFSESTSLGATYSQSFSEDDLSRTEEVGACRQMFILSPQDRAQTGIDIICINPYLRERTSTQTGSSEIKRLDIYFRTGTIMKLTVNPYYITEEELQTDREDEMKGVNVTLSRPISSVITATINGAYGKQEFQPEDEDNTVYNAGFFIEYRVSPRISATASYRHSAKSSNIGINEYHSNIAWIEGRYTF